MRAEVEAVRQFPNDNGLSETRRIRNSEHACYRTHKGGGIQSVMVRLNDAGPRNPNGRYFFDAWVPGAECPESVSTSPSDSIFDADGLVHWRVLDAKGRRGRVG